MLPDRIFSLTMTFDDRSCDLMAVVTNATDGNGESLTWSTTQVPGHTDNAWHTVRDLLLDFVQEAF